MALKGNLSTVSLSDIFQVLSHGHSTGLLRIQAPEGTRFVEIQDGAISIVANTSNRILLGDLLLSRGLLDEDSIKKALELQKESGKLMGQILVDLGLLNLVDIENAVRFQVEEEICDLFLLSDAEFDFLASATLDDKMALGGGLVRLKIDPNSLLMEAARRLEEWKSIQKRIPSQAKLFELEPSGRDLLATGEGLSPEGLILLKLAGEHRSVESMVQKACLGRLDTNVLLLELWDAKLIKPAAAETYLDVARKHLSDGRFEEAKRVAVHGMELGGHGELRKVVDEVKRKQDLSSTAEASRVRSEVIRRPHPSLILKKRSSPLVWVAALLALAAAGGGAWWFLQKNKSSGVSLDEQKQFDAAMQQVEELKAEGKFEEAMEILKWNPSNADLRVKVIERTEKFQKFLVANLRGLLEAAVTAMEAGDDQKVQDLYAEIQRYETLVPDGAATELQSFRDRVRDYNDRARAREFTERFEKALQIENFVARSAELQAILKENPPEAIAVKVRHDVSELMRRRKEASAVVLMAQKLEEAGHLSGAKLEYEKARELFPGSEPAQQADARIATLGQEIRRIEDELRKIENMVIQNRREEARTALLAFLGQKHENSFADRAREMLRGVAPPDQELGVEKLLQQAKQQDAQKEYAKARSLRLEALEKFPLAMASARTTLPVKIETVPSGATILINGLEQAEPTPCMVPVPGMGHVRITLRKKGYEDHELVARDFRQESISARLPKTGAYLPRLLPVPAKDGIAVHGDWVALLNGNQLICVNLGQDAQTALVRKYFGQDAAGEAEATLVPGPVFQVLNEGGPPQVFVSSPKRVWRTHPEKGEVQSMAIDSPAISPPVLFQDAGQIFAGIETRKGFEVRQVSDGALRFEPRLLASGEKPRPLGVRFDGERFFVPRASGDLFTVHAAKAAGSETKLPAEPLYPLACNVGAKAVAAVGANGTLVVWIAEDLKESGRLDLKAKPVFGLAAAGDGFAVAMDDRTVSLVSAAKTEAVFTLQLASGAKLPPLAVGAHAFAVATDKGLHLFDARAGKELWFAPFEAPPVAIAASPDGKRLAVSTQDAWLLVLDSDL